MLRRRALTVTAMAVLLGGIGVFPTDATVEAPAVPAFDARTDDAGIGPSAAQVDAVARLVSARPGTTVRWNRLFGTPSTLVRHGAALSDAVAGAPEAAAAAWLQDNAGLFGWDAAAVGGLRVARVLAQPAGGPVAVLFHQTFGEIEGGNLGGSIVVALDTSNRVLLVRANAVRVPQLAEAATLDATGAFAAATGLAAPAITGTRAGWTEFARGPFAGPHYARPTVFATGDGPARPAWDLRVARGLDDGERVVVDGVTGEVLLRRQAVLHDEARVFQNHPGAEHGGEHELVEIPDAWLGPIPTTAGNNASTATNWGVYIAPDGPGQVRPVGSFDHAFTDAWAASECGVNPINEGLGGFPDAPTYAEDALPATVNLWYHHNLSHDFWYGLGFTEEAGAMQVDNGEHGGEPGDPLLGLVQAGAAAGDQPTNLGRDNAYMFPQPDGIPQWSGMFLFEPIDDVFEAPCVDGDFDASVIYHEYAHGVTSRWVGAEFGNLDTFQGGTMGESWGDVMGLHYLMINGLEDETVIGRYDTGNARRGIRNFRADEVPVGFGDLGYDTVGEEVHADGEIWNGVLWDIRSAMDPALAIQLIADAMPISGPLPTFVDMRDAILAADVARTGGANQDRLWEVFARRGLGVGAGSIDANDINPRPGFAHPDPARNGHIEGRVVDAATGLPVAGARVIVGVYEARVSAIATTGENGRFSLSMMQGTWPLTFQAPGYGTSTVELAVAAGRTPLAFGLQANVASGAAGAVATALNPSVLGPPEFAIDDTARTTWRTDLDDDGPALEPLVIDLAGDAPVAIERLQLSAMVAPGTPRFEALRQFDAYTSMDGENWTPVVAGVFEAQAPRPVTPNLHYASWTLPAGTTARFLQIVASPQSEGMDGVQIADVQAFGPGTVTVAPDASAADEDIHDEGVVVVSTADGHLTYETMQVACAFPPATQGVDAWVTELPDSYADADNVIDVRAEPIAADPRPDIDLYFLSADCRPTGSIATTAARETGLVPQGTKYVVSQLYTTAAATVVVEGTQIE